MGKIAFIFPGQGSQAVGMGVHLADSQPEIAALYKEASQILGWDLLQACREGPEERLKQTDVAQPALYVTGLAAARALERAGIRPEAVAGHSIGEYAALATAGVFSFQDGLKLVRERGRLMQSAARTHPGGMVAVLGMDRDRLEKLCASVQAEKGICVPVNFNSPEQIVVAGERAALDALTAAASTAGAKRIVPLNVSGAFHSPLMKEAALGMKGELAKISVQKASCPVAMNAGGQTHQDPAGIRSALAQQLDHSVEWVRSMEALRALGCDIFVECGAGRVLGGLMKRINSEAQTLSTENVGSFQKTVDYCHSRESGNPSAVLKT